jgi:hypothetical protein
MAEGSDSTPWLDGGSAGKPSSKKRRGAVIGLVTAGLVGGGVLAGTLGASAATSTAATGTYEGPGGMPPSGEAGRPGGPGGHHRGDEKPVSAAISATLTKKALAKVPGAKVDRVETDADGATYEAHMTKTDGTHVTVKFDKNFTITAVETGMGKGPGRPGGPGKHGGPGGRPPGGPSGYGAPRGGSSEGAPQG